MLIRRHPFQRATVLASLKACSSSKDVERGTQIHRDVAESGHDSDMHVATALVDMYANCGRLADARKVFESMPRRDVVSWNALILGCVENGESELALELFSGMQKTGCAPAARTYVAVLMAYAVLASKEAWTEVDDGKLVKLDVLRKGMAIYSRAGVEANVYVATAMVDLCSKCGSMSHARKVFDSIHRPDVGLWNALILGYADNDENQLALQLYSAMRLRPNTRTYVAACKACANLAPAEEPRAIDGRFLKVNSLKTGMALHAQALRSGHDVDTFVANSLVDVYAKCGDTVESRRVFNKMVQRTVVSWTALVAGYVENGEAELALEMFWRMGSERCQPDDRAVAAALQACASLARLEHGRDVKGELVKVQSLEMAMRLHSQLLDSSNDIYSATTLIDAYASCGSMLDAGRVFLRMVQHDVVAWNSLIAGYTENQEPELVLDVFQRMRAEEKSCLPNAFTYSTVLAAVATLAGRDKSGTLVHGKYVKTNWLEKGMTIHSEADQQKLAWDVGLGDSLVNMYMECGSPADAYRVFFHGMPLHSGQSWSKLILGCVDNGEPQLAFELFNRMRLAESLPSSALILAALLKACACDADVYSGRAVHGEICRCGMDESDDPVLQSALIDMYGKCGTVVAAQQVFDSWGSERDSVCWTTLMSGYSKTGECERVLQLLSAMEEEGLEVKASTITSVLSACSHAGLVESGKAVFASMESRFGVPAGVEHYNCVLDMLGRANRLDEAVEVADGMGAAATAQSWRSVLAAAQTWKNERVGEAAFRRLLELEPHHGDASSFVLMANIYASVR